MSLLAYGAGCSGAGGVTVHRSISSPGALLAWTDLYSAAASAVVPLT